MPPIKKLTGHHKPITNPARPVRESSFEDDFSVDDVVGLSDIGNASFSEGPRIEAVLGDDERKQIKDTTKLPWRILASLVITAADDSQWVGTAWFVSPRTLITAGHCVYVKNDSNISRNGWVKEIRVMPARNKSKLPYGSKIATKFWTVAGWGKSGLENYDYGAIILSSPFNGNIGAYEFGKWTNASLLKSIGNVAGYPSDKESGTLWHDKRQIREVSKEKIYYEADTHGGQSGTAVYVMSQRKPVAIGIHTYGGSTSNSGTRISNDVFSNLKSWQQEGG